METRTQVPNGAKGRGPGRHLKRRLVAGLLIGLVAAATPAVASGQTLRAAQTGGGELKIAIATPISTVDPHRTSGAADWVFMYNAFEYLYQFDQDGGVSPRLATSYTISPDGKTYTFNLRPNVKFQDGSPFTAEDVKYSFERFKKPELKQVNAFRVTSATVKVINPLTVSIGYPNIDGGFVANQTFVPIVPKDYVEKVGDDAFAKKPIGTGPWMFDSQTPGSSITMKRWNGYWGKKPAYSGLKVLFQANARSRVNMLKTGQVDIIGGVSPADLGTLSSFKVESQPAGGSMMLSWNMLKNGPWQKDEVREAISYAIDTKPIIKTILKGYGAQSVGGLTPATLGFKEAGVKPKTYDPAKAKALLAKAGYPNGFSMDIIGPVTGRYAGTTEMFQAIGQNLQDIGIKVTTKVVAYADWVNTQRRTTDVNGMFMSYGQNFDYQIFLTSIYTTNASFSHMNDKVLDSLTLNLQTTADPARRRTRVATIAKYLDRSNYMVPLIDDHAIFAMKKGVTWTPWTNQSTPILATARPS